MKEEVSSMVRALDEYRFESDNSSFTFIFGHVSGKSHAPIRYCALRAGHQIPFLERRKTNESTITAANNKSSQACSS